MLADRCLLPHAQSLLPELEVHVNAGLEPPKLGILLARRRMGVEPNTCFSALCQHGIIVLLLLYV